MKAEKLVLHIGHGKTGTTTLQNTLTRAHEVLLENGVLFPKIEGYDGNASILGMHLFASKHAGVYPPHLPRLSNENHAKFAEALWADICKDVDHYHPQTIVISSELFFRPRVPSVLVGANNLNNDLAETSEVVTYLRAPDTHYLSRYQELLKQLRVSPLVSRTLAKDSIQPFAEHWNGQVSFNVFDQSMLTGGDSFLDFMTRYLPDINTDIFPKRDQTYNTSLSAEAMSFLHDCAVGKVKWNGSARVLVEQVAKVDRKLQNPTKPKLRPEVAETLINWRGDDLFWLRDEHGVVFPTIDYDAINPKSIHGWVFDAGGIENVYTFDPDRKLALAQQALKRAKLPKTIRRWLAKY
jgi:hypothetical protein